MGKKNEVVMSEDEYYNKLNCTELQSRIKERTMIANLVMDKAIIYFANNKDELANKLRAISIEIKQGNKDYEEALERLTELN